MEKIQNKHMEAVEAIANMTMANTLLDILGDIMDELPMEFDKSKKDFKQFKSEFEDSIDNAIPNYAEK